MTRPPLSERRRTHTRREIAESAVTLFARDGYDNVSVEDIAEEADLAPHLYRYFSAKDEVLSPIFTQGTEDLLDHIALPACSPQKTSPKPSSTRTGRSAPRPTVFQALIRLFIDVPALQARWLNDLRALEAALVPVVRQRTLLNDHDGAPQRRRHRHRPARHPRAVNPGQVRRATRRHSQPRPPLPPQRRPPLDPLSAHLKRLVSDTPSCHCPDR